MSLITRLLSLLFKTITVRQFLTKQLSVQTNVHRYHLTHEGSSPEVKWLKEPLEAKNTCPQCLR